MNESVPERSRQVGMSRKSCGQEQAAWLYLDDPELRPQAQFAVSYSNTALTP